MPHLIDPHAIGLSLAFIVLEKSRVVVIYFEDLLCAGGHCFQPLLSAYALHLIIHVKNGFAIALLVPVN